MSSQDTMSYAQSEEESANALQQEIDKQQAKIAQYQKDAASDSTIQESVDREIEVMSSLQEKQRQHMSDAQRLREQAMDEERQEHQEQREQQEKDSHKNIGEAAREGIINNLF